MAPRVTSDLLLVGSLPAGSTEAVMRAASEFFGDLVFALPDGETGPRAAWVGYERERLVRPHPDVETVEETASPTGIPRHAYETPVFRLRPGVTELHWDSWPRVDDAIASYQVFRDLRAAGVIPAGLRFQVGLPFPSSALNGFKADFAADYPVAERAFEDLVARDARVYLGIVLPVDGVAGLRRRKATAAAYLADFGVARYCGFGRQPGRDGVETMREHREAVLASRG